MVRDTMLALSAAVVLGLALAAWHMRAEGRRPIWLNWVGLLHGGLGAIALGLLVLAVLGPPRGVASGTGAFGLVAAILLGAAFLVGLTLPVLTRRHPAVSGTVMAIHAGIAITGAVIFLACAAFD